LYVFTHKALVVLASVFLLAVIFPEVVV